jgi:hypothetical protein
LLLDEHRFRRNGTHAAKPGEPSDSHHHVEKKDGQITHGAIGARSPNPQKRPRMSMRYTQDLFCV